MAEKVESHKDLVVWQKSMDLVVLVYKLVQELPKSEQYALSDQIRRAAVSIPSNIAEGKSRNSIKEYKHFIGIAKGSVAELETQLLICERIGYFNKEEISNTLGLLDEVSKMLTKLNNVLAPRT
ncbi:four helix bundle protein [Treponema sp. C6A8]|uniref:four helix bundle protein n=1 Tax=Treponema sp. C6A8 TaxID=1410609 RepID=UPI000487BF85|nr:four helix bundle protein [Treponema sp. C6A8]